MTGQTAGTVVRIAMFGWIMAWASGCSAPDTTSPRSQAVHALRLVPDSVFLVPGQSVDFEVRVLNEWGDELSGRAGRVEWSLFHDAVAEMERGDTSVSVTALAPGQATLSVSLGRGNGSAQIFVSPPGLDHTEIRPTPVVVSVGDMVRPEVRLYDAEGEQIDPARHWISWDVSDSTIARVPPRSSPRHSTRVTGEAAGQTRLSVMVDGAVTRADLLVILEPTPPDSPTVQDASAGSLDLVWARVLRAWDGYRLYRSAQEDGPYQEIAAPGRGEGMFSATADTTYTDMGLEPGTQYFYTLRACNDHGCSEPSGAAAGTTTTSGAGS